MTILTNSRKKGTTYTAIVRKGQYRERPLVKTFPTKGEARAWKAEQEKLISMKRHQDPRLADLVSLAEALDKYFVHGQSILKKRGSTLDREKYSRKNIERILGAETPLSTITPLVINEYQSTRINEHASSSSIRQELALLSRLFDTAHKIWQLPVINPVAKVDRIKPDPGRERFLTETEAAIIVSEAKKSLNPKFYPFVILLLHTGMRTGEAARVTIKDYDINRRLITIRQTKTGRPRTVGMSNQVLDALQSISVESDGYLFLKPTHRASKDIMLRPGCIFRECWNHLAERIERDYNSNQKYRDEHPDFQPILPFRPHDLRHTAGSYLLRQGVDIRVIADILGHSTLQMVMRYTHLFDDKKVEYADILSPLGNEVP